MCMSEVKKILQRFFLGSFFSVESEKQQSRAPWQSQAGFITEILDFQHFSQTAYLPALVMRFVRQLAVAYWVVSERQIKTSKPAKVLLFYFPWTAFCGKKLIIIIIKLIKLIKLLKFHIDKFYSKTSKTKALTRKDSSNDHLAWLTVTETSLFTEEQDTYQYGTYGRTSHHL